MDILSILAPIVVVVVLVVVVTSYTHPMFWRNIKDTILSVVKGKGK